MPQMFDWIFYWIVLAPVVLLTIDAMRTPRRRSPG